LTWDGGGAAGGPGRVRLTLEVSTEGSEALGGGRGGVTAATTPYFVPGDGLTHIAGAYNGTHVEVYVNGTIAASEVACGTPPCGNVTWPLVDNIYIVDHVPVRMPCPVAVCTCMSTMGSASHDFLLCHKSILLADHDRSRRVEQGFPPGQDPVCTTSGRSAHALYCGCCCPKGPGIHPTPLQPANHIFLSLAG
jgi:hypothetical protein